MRRLAQVIVSLVAFAVAGGATGCRTAQSPQLHVIGVREEPKHDVVFVQVTNPVGRAMRLTRLEYRFAAAGQTVSAGEMALARELPAGAAIVVRSRRQPAGEADHPADDAGREADRQPIDRSELPGVGPDRPQVDDKPL
jgi:hypothetical protein